jgi:hypothetical protein
MVPLTADGNEIDWFAATKDNHEAKYGPEAWVRDEELRDKGNKTWTWLTNRGWQPRLEDLANPKALERAMVAYAEYIDKTNEPVGEAGTTETRETEVNADNEWPKPPAEAAYYGLAGDIVKAIAPHTEADPVGLLGTFLTVYGAMVGNSPWMHQGQSQHTNLFVCLVGETSKGRKGTAFGVIKEAFDLAEKGWEQVLVPGLGSGEGLITYLNTHENDPRALIFETEFGRLLTAMAREGSTLSPIVRNAWDGVPLGRQVADAKHSSTVTKHHVGILANITNVELAQKLTSVDAADGFGNRFLWLAVTRPHLMPFTEPIAHYVARYANQLAKAIEYGSECEQMRFTPEARAYWEVFYGNKPPRAGLLAALTGRREPYVARLAMLYALLDQTNLITPAHMQAAEAIWDYAERSAAYIFGDSTGNRHADALLRALNVHSPITWEDAKKMLGIYKAADLEDVVNLLERLGRVSRVKVTRPGGGRPRHELELRR